MNPDLAIRITLNQCHDGKASMPTRPPVPDDLPPEADDPAQSRRFIDMAREVEVDETPGAFGRAFAKVVRTINSKKLPPTAE